MARARQTARPAKLSPAAREALETKKASGRKRAKHWQRLIVELAEFDAASDRLRRRTGYLMALGAGVVVLGLLARFAAWVIAPMDADAPVAVRIACYLAAAGGLVMAIWYGVRWDRFTRLDVANDFRLCLAPLLDALREDIPPKAKVRIDLDLAKLSDQKQTRKESVPPGRFDEVTETLYHDPWCHLVTPLADGSHLRLDIENRFTRHDRWWTRLSRSGRRKTKHKVKWKKLVLVAAAVAPNSERLAWDEEAVSARAGTDKLKLGEKGGARLGRLVRKFKFKAVGHAPEGMAQPEQILAMFMELFALLRPAGARS